MKIKIWQQFSSNHSAGFRIIAQFKTPKEAKHAANELRSMIDTLLTVWRGNDTWLKSISVTPPEREFMEKYGVPWATHVDTGQPRTIDWLRYREEHDPIQQFRNLLFLANYGQSWVGPTPFNYILEKLGAKVSSGVPGYQGDVPNVTISFTLPDKENTVYHDIRYSYFLTPPWRKGGRWEVRLPHISGLITSPGMEDDEEVYKLWDILIDGGYMMFNEPDGNSEACFETLMAIDSLGFEIEHDYRTDCEVMEELSWRLRCENYQMFSSIERDNNHITVRGFDLGWKNEMRDRFAEFILYLEKNSCTEIEWKISGYEDVVGRG